MRRALLSMVALLGACEAPAPRAEAPRDRAALEAAVAACERGVRRTDCEPARAQLAHARRIDRMAAYQQAH